MNNTKISWTQKTWNPIPDFDGYFASSDGYILSKKQGHTRVLNPIEGNDRHLYVFLYDGQGNSKKMYVHRLVLMAFVGFPKDGQECRHLNDIPSDNRIENLVWGTRLENAADKRRNGGLPIGEKCYHHKLTENQVMQIRKRYSDGESSSDLSKVYNVSKNTVLQIVKGKKWSHLPTIPVKTKHKSARKTPPSKEQISILIEAAKKAALKRKKTRMLIPCECGCGELIETPDNRGRNRRFINGHYNYWKYEKNKNIMD